MGGVNVRGGVGVVVVVGGKCPGGGGNYPGVY